MTTVNPSTMDDKQILGNFSREERQKIASTVLEGTKHEVLKIQSKVEDGSLHPNTVSWIAARSFKSNYETMIDVRESITDGLQNAMFGEFLEEVSPFVDNGRLVKSIALKKEMNGLSIWIAVPPDKHEYLTNQFYLAEETVNNKAYKTGLGMSVTVVPETMLSQVPYGFKVLKVESEELNATAST